MCSGSAGKVGVNWFPVCGVVAKLVNQATAQYWLENVTLVVVPVYEGKIRGLI